MIESPSLNSRRITADIIIESSVEDVWSILTDYNRLAVHVPNLVQSYLIPHPTGRLRLFQEGAQKIIGFDFRASLVMDMTEEPYDENVAMRGRRLDFKLVESGMFSAFEGTWSLKYHSRSKEIINKATGSFRYKYKTLLTYTVLVRPKGLVPAIALEWRIREDVPVNLLAVKQAAEKLTLESLGVSPSPQLSLSSTSPSSQPSSSSSSAWPQASWPRIPDKTMDWESDETLSKYIQPLRSQQGQGQGSGDTMRSASGPKATFAASPRAGALTISRGERETPVSVPTWMALLEAPLRPLIGDVFGSGTRAGAGSGSGSGVLDWVGRIGASVLYEVAKINDFDATV